MDSRGESDLEKIERALTNAEASLNVEGMYLLEAERDLIRLSLRGEISDEQFMQQARQMASGK